MLKGRVVEQETKTKGYSLGLPCLARLIFFDWLITFLIRQRKKTGGKRESNYVCDNGARSWCGRIRTGLVSTRIFAGMELVAKTHRPFSRVRLLVCQGT